ncbi:MAG: hypothetical protein HDQ98_08200 [Lachnospiraceae bacterium]|nr:hypothetical protein [Lachnospiraceae bacterium]
MEKTADQLLTIIRSVKPIEIDDLDDSIFSSKYGLEPCDLAYILLFASERMGFPITEELIDFMEEHNSFRNLIDYISRHMEQKACM